jgi:hypothetical protein
VTRGTVRDRKPQYPDSYAKVRQEPSRETVRATRQVPCSPFSRPDHVAASFVMSAGLTAPRRGAVRSCFPSQASLPNSAPASRRSASRSLAANAPRVISGGPTVADWADSHDECVDCVERAVGSPCAANTVAWHDYARCMAATPRHARSVLATIGNRRSSARRHNASPVRSLFLAGGPRRSSRVMRRAHRLRAMGALLETFDSVSLRQPWRCRALSVMRTSAEPAKRQHRTWCDRGHSL